MAYDTTFYLTRYFISKNLTKYRLIHKKLWELRSVAGVELLYVYFFVLFLRSSSVQTKCDKLY